MRYSDSVAWLQSVWTLGKSPLFEVRQMNLQANTSLKSTPCTEEERAENPKVTNNENKQTRIESDMEDDEYSSKSKKMGTNGSVGSRSSLAHVYTHKVTSESSILIFVFYVWWRIK